MSDSEYSSEDDEDYVPEPESESEAEDVQGLEGNTISSGKSKKTQAPKRKRKGGIKLADDDDDIDDDDDEVGESDEDGGLDVMVAEEKARKKQTEDEKSKKARMEDLWASFKSDTASVRQQSSTPSPSTEAVISKAESTNISKTNMLNTAQSSTDVGKVPDTKITITKTFDFAGESVKVTKKVDANSEEAKLAKKQEETKEATNPPNVGNFSGTKRKGGLGSILGQIGKKPKISTLDKSKLDWESFKTETGISDDLRNYNKNGFLEKQDFLQRTDERQFEREKQTRAAIRKQ